MQSLLEQTRAISDLGATMQAPSNGTCHCTAMRACWYHRPLLLRTRRLTREQYRTEAHERRQRRYEAEQRERDYESFHETFGYAMPVSTQIDRGYIDVDGDE